TYDFCGLVHKNRPGKDCWLRSSREAETKSSPDRRPGFWPAPFGARAADGTASATTPERECSLPMKTIARDAAEILVVDEDSLASASVASALDAAGHVVYQTRDRLAALKVARTEPLD